MSFKLFIFAVFNVAVITAQVKVDQQKNSTVTQNVTTNIVEEKLPSEGGGIVSNPPVLTPVEHPANVGRELGEPNVINRTTEAGAKTENISGTSLKEAVKATSNDPTVNLTDSLIKNHTVSPRKGVTFVPLENASSTTSSSINSTTPSTTTTTTTTTEQPVKKPLITENDDIVESSSKNNDSSSPSLHSANNLELLQEQKERQTARYVIPIIGVILSVPLVAVVISILYKRGSEWWQHRHYRRMDFLIEGMYNN